MSKAPAKDARPVNEEIIDPNGLDLFRPDHDGHHGEHLRRHLLPGWRYGRRRRQYRCGHHLVAHLL
ncbi:MAG: hypothetical protein ACLTSX_03920 [Collinsella sp.]